ncbi:MAG: sulfotransferase [Acidimicrobiaceae bacterium]|nr:sulfotransferase [Acidimicrobiaceae bacterium]MYD05425.1 sulfotransferase [Acidimicrobiaceae bacterium]MYI59884.1 sulfotransferase [Acidimicrobiaceae bacterium]
MNPSSGTPPTAASRIAELIDKAKADTGFDDFGGDTWREGLEVLIGSATAEATLSDMGEQGFYRSVVRSLSNRLKIEDWFLRHPEIDEQTVEIELVGVGLPRTGSTALSHLLCEDRAFRNLLTWEEGDPCPPPGIDPSADQTRIDATAMVVDMAQDHMAARLRSMLPMSATGPMEDHNLMALEFKAQIFLVMGHMPTYADWFAHCDMEPTYRYEKRVLKLLQWKTDTKVWRLKSPTHTMFLDAYLRVFPDAKFVQTHHDVAKVLPSVCDLYYTLLKDTNPGIDVGYIGELNMEHWSIAMNRMLAFRQDPANDARFFDIGFSEFQTDPMSQIRQLYEWLGDELDQATVDRMLAWRADNPRDKHGRHTYDAAQFGITDQALTNRFAPYLNHFAPLLT